MNVNEEPICFKAHRMHEDYGMAIHNFEFFCNQKSRICLFTKNKYLLVESDNEQFPHKTMPWDLPMQEPGSNTAKKIWGEIKIQKIP